jgi:hypothetical protein
MFKNKHFHYSDFFTKMQTIYAKIKASTYTSVTGLEKKIKASGIVIYTFRQEPINQARINDF